MNEKGGKKKLKTFKREEDTERHSRGYLSFAVCLCLSLMGLANLDCGSVQLINAVLIRNDNRFMALSDNGAIEIFG